MTTIYKYRFRICYQDDKLKRTSEFMSKLDLGFDGIGIKENWEFTGTKDIPISVLKERITWAVEECGGKVLDIEGGKVE